MDAAFSDQALARDPVRDRLHDLRNLFGVVASGAHLLTDNQGSERRATVLRAMDSAALRGAEILSAMLAGSQDPEAQICRLPERLARLAPLLTTMVGEGIHLRLDLTAQPACIACQAEQFDRVVLELVANARKAIANDGRIDVRVRFAQGKVWLIVADTGTGMNRRQLARALKPHSGQRLGAHGTGMGQVRAFVRDTGGRLYVRSRRGLGTVVCLALPAIAAGATGLR